MYLNEPVASDETIVWIAFFALVISIFIGISLVVHRSKDVKIDRVILSKLHSIKHPILDMIFEALTWFGSLKIIAPIMVGVTILLIELKHTREAILADGGIVVAVISVYLFKFVFGRDRPDEVLSADELPADPSFPSAHTLQIFITFSMLWLAVVSIGGSWFIGLGIYLFLLALAVGISRLYLQVHYPTDVLAGMILAIFWSAVVVLISKSGVI